MSELPAGSDLTQEETLRLHEAEWIEAAKTGDPEAIGQLYGLHYENLQSQIANKIWGRADIDTAQDLTQKVMLKALYSPSFKKFENKENKGIRRYLTRVAMRVMIDEGRWTKSHEADSLEEIMEYDFEHNEPISSDKAVEDIVITNMEVEDTITQLKQKLFLGNAQALVLAGLGFEYEEIGELCDTPANTAGTRIHKGRKLFLAALVNEGVIRESGESATFGLYDKLDPPKPDLCA